MGREILSETCDWLYLTKVVYELSVLYLWLYCKYNGDKSVHIIHIMKPTDARMLKLYFLHTICPEMFRSILIIFRELVYIKNTFVKTE